MRRRAAYLSAFLLLAICSFVAGQASAQTTPSIFQDYTFVRDSSGETWLVLKVSTGAMVRVGVPIYPASDEQIASVPANGQWLVPGDGSRMSFERPTWAMVGTAIGQAGSGLQSIFQATTGASTIAQQATPTFTPIATFTALPTSTPQFTPTPAVTPTPVPTATPLVTATLVPTSTPVATSTPTDGLIKREGKGKTETSTFRLNGGTYVIRWDLDIPKKSNFSTCVFTGRLRNRESNSIFTTFASETASNGRQGESRLSIPAGTRWSFDIEGDCEWEVWITPSS